MKANTIKNVFTMASLYFLRNLLNISCKLLPFLIIALSLLNLSKTILFNWRDIVLLLILEAILIVGTIIFYSLFFKKDKNDNINNAENKENADSSSENNSKTNDVTIQSKNKLPILNIAVAFLVFLTFIFIILKLFNAVAWSWVWVLFPLWFSTALIISILIIFLIYLIISIIAKSSKNNKKDSDDNLNIESTDNNTEHTNSDNN
ncbi:hypothetical protein [Brachyspira pilosicoli]|uniref:hypothetical protein n=1 Tax=Brachyspira pilosicoli TaxID=52584 RepID=UPI0030063313